MYFLKKIQNDCLQSVALNIRSISFQARPCQTDQRTALTPSRPRNSKSRLMIFLTKDTSEKASAHVLYLSYSCQRKMGRGGCVWTVGP